MTARFRPCLLGTGLALVASLLVAPSLGHAAGFEIGEHTPLSTARGGVGVASKHDPSALYFNPSLLPTARGTQVHLGAELIDANLSFERDDLVIRRGDTTQRTEFDETVRNQTAVTPVPSAAVSHDFGLDDFGAGVGVFAPHAVAERCYGTLEDGDCQPDRDGAGRHMLVHSYLIEFYVMAGAGYEFDLRHGSLRLGASAGWAHQNADFELVVNSDVAPNPPWEEDPETESVFAANNLTGSNIMGVIGATYEHDNVRVAASYRPPMRWKSTGTAEVDFPDDIDAELTDDEITFETWQAGSLRLGWQYREGEHPGRPARPEFDLEVNGVWEDWSRVENFRLTPAGDIRLGSNEDAPTVGLRPFIQRKNWRDTFSLRVGGSWGALSWLTLHAGSFLETAAQEKAYTNLAFPSWERYSGSLGASFHAADWLDLHLAFMHVTSPERNVENGEVYNQIPTSSCEGPDFDDDACAAPGRPPGNPQNEGTWRAHYNIGSVGATLRFD